MGGAARAGVESAMTEAKPTLAERLREPIQRHPLIPAPQIDIEAADAIEAAEKALNYAREDFSRWDYNEGREAIRLIDAALAKLRGNT